MRGTSALKVNELVFALGDENGTSRSEVSHIGPDVDENVAALNALGSTGQQFIQMSVNATYAEARVGSNQTDYAS